MERTSENEASPDGITVYFVVTTSGLSRPYTLAEAQAYLSVRPEGKLVSCRWDHAEILSRAHHVETPREESSPVQ